MVQKIAIIGSTGIVGKLALDVIQKNPEHFKIVALGTFQNAKLLHEQAEKNNVQHTALYSEKSWEKLIEESDADKVVFASSGTSALPAVFKAIDLKKNIAIANKELIVAYGQEIMERARAAKIQIIPIDSEHSGIFQCLLGEKIENVEKVTLTCSGGPFLGKKSAELKKVTAEQALNHPTWNMGKQITIDSATLMNKGFEIIEAVHLFGLREDQIEVVVHPECIIHALVHFKDGSVKAHMGYPDMRLPILYALSYPDRVPMLLPRFDLTKLGKLTFMKPDEETFKGIQLARAALKIGNGTSEKLLNANRKAVKLFLEGKTSFSGIYDAARAVL